MSQSYGIHYYYINYYATPLYPIEYFYRINDDGSTTDIGKSMPSGYTYWFSVDGSEYKPYSATWPVVTGKGEHTLSHYWTGPGIKSVT